MFTNEEIDSWNEIFPNSKIKQADLTNPTEAFLTKTLILYLEMFGYDMKNVDGDARERRLFLIKLTQHIDHILKITDKSYTFTYYDLIRPTPKKTSHMLGILLNYLYYYNMYKTDVFTRANEVLRTRAELQTSIRNTELENQQLKQQSEKINEEIEIISEKLPKATAMFESLKEQKLKQLEEIQKLEDTFVRVKSKLDELDVEKRNLKKKLVPDSEANRLKSELQKLQEKIAEQNALEASTNLSLKERTESIKEMQDLLKEIEEMRDRLPMRQLETIKEMEKTLKNAKSSAAEKQHKKNELVLLIQKEENAIKAIKEKLNNQKIQFEKDRINKQKEIGELMKARHAKETELTHLQLEEHTLNCLYQEQEEIKSYLEENIANLMIPYMSKHWL